MAKLKKYFQQFFYDRDCDTSFYGGRSVPHVQPSVSSEQRPFSLLPPSLYTAKSSL